MTKQERRKPTQVHVGKKKVIKLGGSLAIVLPKEFTSAHGIEAGDELAYVADHLMKLVPSSERV